MPKGGTKFVDRFLPLQPLSPSPSHSDTKVTEREESIRHFYAHVSMPIPNEAASAEPLFPGQQHKIYRAIDHDGTLPEDYSRVLQLVSKVTGIPSSVIENTVSRIETRYFKREAGWKIQRSQVNQVPPQGVETQMFGKLREKGGATPWPSGILPSADHAKGDKEKAVLYPKMQV